MKKIVQSLLAKRGYAIHRIDSIVPTRQLTNQIESLQTQNAALREKLWRLRMQAGPFLREPAEIAKHHGKASVFVATLPKSGTMYIGITLAKSLEHSFCRTLVTDGFPRNIVHGQMLADYMQGGLAVVSHMEPHPQNIASLGQAALPNKFKMVLHVRDPRAAIHSWAHHAARTRQNGQSASDILDTLIADQYRHMVDWTVQWASVLDSQHNLDILVTRHDDLARDPENFFRSIFRHYGHEDDPVLAERSTGTHFRKGDNQEWREVFTPEQYRHVTALLPLEIRERFGWD